MHNINSMNNSEILESRGLCRVDICMQSSAVFLGCFLLYVFESINSKYKMINYELSVLNKQLFLS